MGYTVEAAALRGAAAYELRREGATFAAIGKAYGVGTERARQIVAKHHRILWYKLYCRRLAVTGAAIDYDEASRKPSMGTIDENGRYVRLELLPRLSRLARIQDPDEQSTGG